MTEREKAFLLHGIAQYNLARAIVLAKIWKVESSIIAATFQEVWELPEGRRINGECE